MLHLKHRQVAAVELDDSLETVDTDQHSSTLTVLAKDYFDLANRSHTL
jgi:hypothetical protein